MRTRFASTACHFDANTNFVRVFQLHCLNPEPSTLNPQHGPPKEKHVQTLLIALNNGNPPKEVFSELVPRLQSKDATTVLKV